jgi:hypothetical protein
MDIVIIRNGMKCLKLKFNASQAKTTISYPNYVSYVYIKESQMKHADIEVQCYVSFSFVGVFLASC